MTDFMNHYTMLVDQNRNKQFWKALQGCNLQNKVILDIGTGIGTRAIFAVKSKAKHVYACEKKDIIKAANLLIQKSLSKAQQKKITLISKDISRCTLADFNNTKVDIILSEWMGGCLFHERRLENVLDARDKFLKKGGLMMPSKAILCISLIENNEKREDNDEDLEFWKTNGDNHDQDFKKLYGIDIRSLHHHAVKDFYTHIISQRVEPENIISNIAEHSFDLYKIKKSDLQEIRIPWKKFKLLKQTLLAGICFHFKVEFENFHKKHTATLTTEPGIYNYWKQGIAYFNNFIEINKGTKALLKVGFEIFDDTSFTVKMQLLIGKNKYLKSCVTKFEYI